MAAKIKWVKHPSKEIGDFKLGEEIQIAKGWRPYQAPPDVSFLWTKTGMALFLKNNKK